MAKNAKEEEEVMPGEDELGADELAASATPPPSMGAGMKHSVMDIPELSGKKVGDTIVFTVQEVSSDGETYTLVPAGEEGAPKASKGKGRGAVASEILGTEGA